MLVLVLLALVWQANCQPLVAPKIFWGSQASIEEAPFFAQILMNGTTGCGGVIISQTKILTAAHCVSDDTTTYTVKVGSDFLNQGREYQINRIKVHPEYQSKTIGIFVIKSENDIAVITLEQPLEFCHKVKAIKLPDKNYKYEDKLPVTLVGMGKEGFLLPQSKHLKKTTLEILTDCGKEDVICTTSLWTSSCAGDSGGPLFYGDILVGLVSTGDVFCKGFMGPTQFTNVFKMRDFIDSEMNTNRLLM